jgi:hypothetical protein
MSFNFLTYAMLLANPQMPIKFSLHPPNIYFGINPLGTIVLMVLPLSFYRFFNLVTTFNNQNYVVSSWQHSSSHNGPCHCPDDPHRQPIVAFIVKSSSYDNPSQQPVVVLAIHLSSLIDS